MQLETFKTACQWTVLIYSTQTVVKICWTHLCHGMCCLRLAKLCDYAVIIHVSKNYDIFPLPLPCSPLYLLASEVSVSSLREKFILDFPLHSMLRFLVGISHLQFLCISCFSALLCRRPDWFVARAPGILVTFRTSLSPTLSPAHLVLGLLTLRDKRLEPEADWRITSV